MNDNLLTSDEIMMAALIFVAPILLILIWCVCFRRDEEDEVPENRANPGFAYRLY